MEKGLTLIEFLVAISVFSIVSVGALELFSSGFQQQRESLNSIYLLNNASFATEYITRSLRMVQKETGNSQCLSQEGMNCQVTRSGKGIKFINYWGECQEFYLQGYSLKVRTPEGEQDLFPNDIRVKKLQFQTQGESQEDFLQPRITVSFELKTLQKPEKRIRVQTTVSQRELDVKY